jgi:DNA-binding FadR family transcriptional regulator
VERGTYIKLFRKFKKWKWYKHPVTKSVFLHLLIEAQWNDRFVHGVKLERGQILTTENDLADELGLSRQQVRTALGHLTSTNEITKETIKVLTEGLTNRATNRMTLITVENYSLYQMGALVATEDITEPSTEGLTNQTTDQQPSLNQTSYYINNDNKEYKDINNSACARARTRGEGNDEEKGISKAMRDVMLFRRMCEENDRD